MQVETDAGRRYDLRTGQQLSFEKDTWQAPRTLSQPEAAARRQKSTLLNGFSAPMETLPAIEQGLGLTAQPAQPAAPLPR